MKLFLHILKRAVQAGIILVLSALLFTLIGVYVFTTGIPMAYSIIIMLGFTLVFLFFVMVIGFAYAEYKSEFKTKTNESN